MPEKKLITIPHNGPIFPKSSIQGPVETPYWETLDTIATLLLTRYPVVEHVGDEKIALSVQNYRNDFSVEQEVVAPKEQAPVVPPADAPKVENKPEQAAPQLSKAERKKLERERREQEQRKQDESQQPDVTL